MVVDQTLASIVILLVSAVVGWLFSRIEGAHKKVNQEAESRHETHLALLKEINDRMRRHEVINFVDTRVIPIDANVKEMKVDIKEIRKTLENRGN